MSTLDDDLDEDGYLNSTDCDDNDSSVNPGATEICDDTKDNDCDEATDDFDSYCIINGDGDYFIAERYSWQSEDLVGRVVPIDFDSDNDLDIVLTPLNPNTIPQTFGKLKALENDGQANFTDASFEVFQNAIWGNDNDYAVADFNGDDLIDLFLPEGGPDIDPFPGGQSKIFFQNQDGQLIDETIERLPIGNLFTHYCTVGDIENDNDIDIILNNTGGNKVGSKLYINDGNGYFTTNSNRLPDALIPPPCSEGKRCDPAITPMSSLFLDTDKDGDNDLIVSGGRFPHDFILLNDGFGYYSITSESVLPSHPLGLGWTTIEIVSSDFNGDSWPDLILVTTRSEAGGNRLFLQYLINNQDGTFYDASILIPGNDEHNNFVKIADFNNDGYMDFLSDHGSVDGNDNLYLYFNTGEGGFINKASLLPPECKRYFKTCNIGDFDNDGDMDIFLWSGSNAGFQYHVIRNNKPFDINTIPVDAPTPTILVSPTNDGTTNMSPTLSWNENETAKSYCLQIATDADFENIIGNKDTICSTHYTVDLDISQIYYWRVRGSNTGGTGEWSEVWSFSSENYAPISIKSSPNCITDSSPIGTTVGYLITTDPDRKDVHIYSFAIGNGINDADNGNFIIEGNVLKTNIEIDYPTRSSYKIYVETDDGFGGLLEQSLIIKVIPVGLVAFYPFEGNANDESRSGNHGIVSGATLTTDRFESENSAYSFDGIDDSIILGTGLNLVNNADSLTIAAWIYPFEVSPPGTYREYNILNEMLGGDNYQFMIYENSLSLNFLSDGISSTGGTIKSNEWQFVAVTYDGENITFYVNAEPVTTTPASGNIDGNHSILFVGSWGIWFGEGNVFDGKIDDILIYNRALSNAEIQSLFVNGI